MAGLQVLEAKNVPKMDYIGKTSAYVEVPLPCQPPPLRPPLPPTTTNSHSTAIELGAMQSIIFLSGPLPYFMNGGCASCRWSPVAAG